MKKVFLFFGIFAACLILCLYALGACDKVIDRANAVVVVAINDGRTKPNVLPYYDFSSIVYAPNGFSDATSDGLYSYRSFEYDSGLLIFDEDSGLVYGDEFLWFLRWTCPSTGNYYLTASLLSLGEYFPHAKFSVLTVSSSSSWTGNNATTSSSNRLVAVSSYSPSHYSYTAGTTYYFVCAGGIGSGGTGNYPSAFDIGFEYIKLEEYFSPASNSNYSFTGFVVPGYTYQVNDSGTDYWDDWDGVVRPNRLRNSSEFVDATGWVLPSDVIIDDQLITVSSLTDPVYIKNRTSRSFDPQDNEYLTLSCFVTDLSGSASLAVTGTSVSLVSDTDSLVEGLNYVTFRIVALGAEVTPEFSIYLSANSSISISWVKMERGDLFTGYVVNVDELYDLAYSQGYLDGSQAYAFRSLEINYNNVETNVESIGWSDFGIEDEEQLAGAFWSLTSSWFEDQGYNVTSSGRFFIHQDVTQNGVTTTNYGIVLYVSVAEITALTDLTSPSYPTVYVTMMEHQSSFHVFDTEFPDPWNPVQYPDARKVRINVQLGVQEWLDSVSSAADKLGYQRGLDEGYASGRESGYRDGFNYGYEQTQTGTWRAMFSALIGVPITYLVSLFDFEILGFNFLSVFKTIVVISLFLFIVKALLGKVAA